MCLGQTVGNLRCDGDSAAKREWTKSQQLTQRLTANQLHSDVVCAVHVSKFVNGYNLGWFSAEAASASRWKRLRACASCATSSGKNFKSHKAAKLGIPRLVDHTHASPAQFFNDAIMRNCSADRALPIVRFFGGQICLQPPALETQ